MMETSDKGKAMVYHKVLVAIDRSSQGEVVFQKAVNLAKSWDAKLKLFHCIDIMPLTMGSVGNLYGQGLGRASQLQQELIHQEVENVQGWLNTFLDYTQQHGITAEIEHQIGEPGYWIREIAERWNADLIIVGRHARSELAEFFLGSVSSYVLHHVKCSVLIVQELNG